LSLTFRVANIEMAKVSVVVLLMARLAFGKDPCDCSDGTWSYKGADYEGCSETADWANHSWCYVEDGATCITATASSIEGETRKYQECSACDCQTQWSYKGADYEGCAETSDWANTDWCYVRGTSCVTATASSVEGETRKYRECSACNCLKTWTYQDTVHDGCSETADWADTDWCYVQGRSNCITASASSVSGENKWYQQCSPCNCRLNWNYQGALYDGCAETPDWTDHSWCYVQGGSHCITASPSSVAGEDRSYRECSACNCLTQWNYEGAVYEGCAETPDWAGHDWCYVQGGSSCPSATTSAVVGEDKKYIECSPCKCLSNWNYAGAMYDGCAETPDWAGHKWCYVQGGSSCASAVASAVVGEDKKYIECTDAGQHLWMTCGEAKETYKVNNCCGNPNALFKVDRRLTSSNDEPLPIDAHVAKVLQEAAVEGTDVDSLAQKIQAVVKPYLKA